MGGGGYGALCRCPNGQEYVVADAGDWCSWRIQTQFCRNGQLVDPNRGYHNCTSSGMNRCCNNNYGKHFEDLFILHSSCLTSRVSPIHLQQGTVVVVDGA